MSKKIALSLLISLIFSFNYAMCQNLDQDMMKAIACISVLKKMGDKVQDQRLVSSYLITCFITIDDQTTQKLISNQFSNNLNLEKKEIDKLTDITQLQTKYSQSDIEEYSKRLNNALEKLKNSNIGQNMQPGNGENTGSSKNSENTGLIGFMIKGLMGLFNPGDSFLFLIGLFVLSYFCLKSLRKLLNAGKKNTNKKKGKKN